MGKVISAKIQQLERWYNPLYIFDGNEVVKEIQYFVFFNPINGDKIGQTGRGWFESKSIAPFEIKLERKNKEDLTLRHPFYMIEKCPYEDETKAVVYIPAEVGTIGRNTEKAYEKGVTNTFTHTLVFFKDIHGKENSIVLTSFNKSEYSEKWNNREKIVDYIKANERYSVIPSRDIILAVAKAMKDLELTFDDVIE